MSSKKQGGKLTQRTRPNPKHLGIKVADGETVSNGSILVRQSGTKFLAGSGVKIGRDHTLYAIINGIVIFAKKQGKNIISIK